MNDATITGKAVFIAPTLPLAEQQTNYLRRYLRDKWRVGKIIGGGSEAPKGVLFSQRDVVVLTPASLLNLLETPSPADHVSITDLSLLIFDEAHHTDGKHAYMSVMNHYLELKLAGEKSIESEKPKLPQVVGMTASVGGAKVAAAAYETGPTKKHIYQLAGNLDSRIICTVVSSQEARESLEAAVPSPEDRLEQVAADFHRLPFAIHIDDLMRDVEIDFNHRINQLILAKVPALEGLGERKEYKRHSEPYGNRISTLLSKLPSLPDSTTDKRTLITKAEHLKIYHTALELQSQLPTGICLRFLSDRFASIDERLSDQTDLLLAERRQRCFDKLKTYPSQDNSLITKLYQILNEELLQKDSETRGIVFVRTRDLAHLLRKAIAEHRTLASLSPEILTSSNTSDLKGGQTPDEQKASLNAFREGRCRLLVATTVGEEGSYLVLRFLFMAVGSMFKAAKTLNRSIPRSDQ